MFQPCITFAISASYAIDDFSGGAREVISNLNISLGISLGLWMKGQVLHREQAHYIVPGWLSGRGRSLRMVVTSPSPPPLPPPRRNGSEGTSTKTWHLIVFCDVTFFCKNMYIRFFREFWLPRVGNLLSYKRTRSRTTEIYDEVLRQVCATFGTVQEAQQKAIDTFFVGKDVSVLLPTGYGKSLINQAAPVMDRLSSLEETGYNIYFASS